MSLAPAIRGRAPSSSVLRYLRSQVDNQYFFTSNERCGAVAAKRLRRYVSGPESSGPSWLPFCPSERGDSNLGLPVSQASFLNLDFLWPRKSGKISKHTSGKAEHIPGFGHDVGHRYGLGGPRSAQNRHASSNESPWLRRLRILKGPNEDTPNGPKQITDDRKTWENAPDVSMFSLNRSMTGKASNELKLRCTEFDENGNVVLVNGEFKKSELIAKYGLLPRDLRKIDSSLLPHILVRPSAILINLLHLRVLIKYNRVLVFDIYGSTDSFTQSVFMYDLEGKLRQKEGSRQAGGLPYEFRALEAVLISVTSALEGEFEGVREPVVKVLRELEEDIDREKLRYLLIYSKKLGTFEQKAKLVRDAIDELLEADDDLSAMYLTEKSKGIKREEDDHTDVEMLLESYHKICDEIVQESGNLVNNIRNTEEIVKAILDANRNSLMLLDLKFSIGTLGMGSGAFIAALYGMNLKNFIEETDFGFVGVSLWSFALAACVCAYGLHKLKRLQRVSMWGERGRRTRNWNDLDPLPGLTTQQSRADKMKKLKDQRINSQKDIMRSQYTTDSDPPALKDRTVDV